MFCYYEERGGDLQCHTSHTKFEQVFTNSVCLVSVSCLETVMEEFQMRPRCEAACFALPSLGASLLNFRELANRGEEGEG